MIAFLDHAFNELLNSMVSTIKHQIRFLVFADDNVGKTIRFVMLVFVTFMSFSTAFKVSIDAKWSLLLLNLMVVSSGNESRCTLFFPHTSMCLSKIF